MNFFYFFKMIFTVLHGVWDGGGFLCCVLCRKCTFNYMIPKLMLNNVAAVIEDWNDNNKNNNDEDDDKDVVGWLRLLADDGGLEISCCCFFSISLKSTIQQSKLHTRKNVTRIHKKLINIHVVFIIMLSFESLVIIRIHISILV